MDVLLLSIDTDLRIVRERENTGYAMRAGDLIELAVAGRVGIEGKWVDWLHVTDARPTGEPLLDASLAALAAAPKRLMPTDWMCEQPGRGAVDEGLALLGQQGVVQLYSRRLNSRLTLTEPVLLYPGLQQQAMARLDRYLAAGSAAADVLDWALAGLVFECDLWTPGHADRPAWRQYKEAAQGPRGKTGPSQEARIRTLIKAAHNARNRDP